MFATDENMSFCTRAEDAYLFENESPIKPTGSIAAKMHQCMS